MKRIVLKVDGMSCEHCAMAITKALKDLPGVSSVAVDLAAKTVTVDHTPERVIIETIKDGIKNEGYTIID
jgi:copper chaperone